MRAMNSSSAKYLVIGGGIAGVSCVEEIASLCPDDDILLLTASPAVKSVINWRQVYGALEQFDVEERAGSHLEAAHPNVRVHLGTACRLDAARKVVHTDAGEELAYERLCICTGARPKVVADGNPHVLGIRDTDSTQEFQKRLEKARRVVVIGNGGIALELVHEVRGCDVIWAIKDRAIGTSFFDAGAAAFFLPHLVKTAPGSASGTVSGPCKRQRYAPGRDSHGSTQAEQSAAIGSALGPDWHEGLSLEGAQKGPCRVHVEYGCEVERILSPEEVVACSETPLAFPGPDSPQPDTELWPVYARLTNGRTFGCDLVVSATGVVPNVAAIVARNELALADDGGLRVDEQMRTSVPCVYAAGDVCSAAWEPRPHWFQMRLWTQARQMGAHAARAMAAHADGRHAELDLCFDLFTHVTSFFGYKVILLGRFNGQGLATRLNKDGGGGSSGNAGTGGGGGGDAKVDGDDGGNGNGDGGNGNGGGDGSDAGAEVGGRSGQELLVRSSGTLEYVKVVLLDGRMAGAVLVGDTDLEETFHNLILNGTDLSPYGEDLLHPDVDIEDYFD
ncbi:pyridine nucleotide-disulfide oxidoreductase domain-containing protein 1 [Lethenteron reissneri]|uniref:pyridine nucleotide-disulfide oxidoreductase domain-containing protein 1 n=1 Tax=Lethenteron reissneri TaxID=7753 RepID=UPI002AB705DE|nr:pyridine nucleotide-disulfide oxidoreductase domain-containing protein 1 [Lethenteron reissneri]